MTTVEFTVDTTCGSLLRQLQHIWDEVGESDSERDKMLLQLEQECLEVYRRKVEQANHARSCLHQALTDAEAEIASLVFILGDRNCVTKIEKQGATLKEQLLSIHPQLEELRNKKEERLQQFAEVKGQIKGIVHEISGSAELDDAAIFATGSKEDLSQERLEEYHMHLKALEKEKEDRCLRVRDYIGIVNDICSVLGKDTMEILVQIDSDLTKTHGGDPCTISDTTLNGLKLTIESLKSEKKCRLRKLQDLGASLVELWTLLDSRIEEQNAYQHIISLAGAAEDDVSGPEVLSLTIIHQAEAEVKRLDELKVSKMKELVVKKKAELDKTYLEAHMEPDVNTVQDKIMAIIESGSFDASELLTTFDRQIANAKEEALSRKEILEKMDKWVLACEEETWLEDYNRDENRYSASRGAHINLKRAEKARITIQKMPGMVENLIQKTKAWEEEHSRALLYDGMRLLDVLEEHNSLRKEREQEKRRLRDQRRMQEQMATEQEASFGLRPSPHKPLSAKKGLSLRPSNGNSAMGTPNKRLSLGGAVLKLPDVTRKTPVRAGKEGNKDKTRPSAPVNYVAMAKEEAVVD